MRISDLCEVHCMSPGVTMVTGCYQWLPSFSNLKFDVTILQIRKAFYPGLSFSERITISFSSDFRWSHSNDFISAEMNWNFCLEKGFFPKRKRLSFRKALCHEWQLLFLSVSARQCVVRVSLSVRWPVVIRPDTNNQTRCVKSTIDLTVLRPATVDHVSQWPSQGQPRSIKVKQEINYIIG